MSGARGPLGSELIRSRNVGSDLIFLTVCGPITRGVACGFPYFLHTPSKDTCCSFVQRYFCIFFPFRDRHSTHFLSWTLQEGLEPFLSRPTDTGDVYSRTQDLILIWSPQIIVVAVNGVIWYTWSDSILIFHTCAWADQENTAKQQRNATMTKIKRYNQRPKALLIQN